MLRINLKTGVYIDIHKFEKVSYNLSGTLKEKTSKNFNEFIIGSNTTYIFKGSTTISIRGEEILYVELTSDED